MALPFVSLLEKEFIYRAAVLLPYARRSTAEERNARNGIRLKQMLRVIFSGGKKKNFSTALFQMSGIGDTIHKGQHGCEQQTQVSDARER